MQESNDEAPTDIDLPALPEWPDLFITSETARALIEASEMTDEELDDLHSGNKEE